MANTLNQVGIETGNIVEAYHITQSIDAFTGTVDYDIYLSGSFNMTGSINGEPGIINPLTASYAITTSYAETASYAISASYEINYETSSSYAETASIAESSSYALSASYVESSSYALSASYVESSSYAESASYALSASYVNLVAGPNIFINQVGTSFEISSSGGGGGGITPSETGSFYYSSSVNLNTITFYQGDGTSENITVDTGSASVGTYKVITSTDPGTVLTGASGTSQVVVKSILIPAGTFTTGDIVRILFWINAESDTGTTVEIRAYINNSPTNGGSMILGATNSDFINLGAFTNGGGITRNLHISSSTITSWPSFQSDTWKTDEGGDGFWNFPGSTVQGYATGNINWATTKYLVITGKFAPGANSLDKFNIRAVKITN